MPIHSSLGPVQWRAVVQQVAQLPDARTRTLPTVEAGGLVLAAPLLAARPAPQFPQSAMDGFAIRSIDAPHRTYRVIGDIPAGVTGDILTADGDRLDLDHSTLDEQPSALRIMTGARVPDGFDIVVPVEHTDAEQTGDAPASITIHPDAAAEPATFTPGRHIRDIGEEIPLGAELAEAGRRLTPTLIAVALAAGTSEVTVEQPRRVAIIMTGDELVSAHSADAGDSGEVLESNGPALAASLRHFGVRSSVEHISDEPAALIAAVARRAADSDLIITTGGVGSGAYDVVKAAFAAGTDSPAAGASRFEHLAMRPGGPQGVGTYQGVPMVHLPGTPVGAIVGFHLFIRPLFETVPSDIMVPAEQAEEANTGHGPRTPRRRGAEVKPAVMEHREGAVVVREVPGRRLLPYATADAMMVTGLQGTDEVLVIPLLTGK
ncbi:molybdopterin molybdotransferase MoeA [Helcobacillus massiliensis]|uniref:molybdopterin molybdotransferase MoeA n=1 Tax=Helcobacillus massiliensis TaxID=521392 RepID=UPI002554DA19|nr:molybdopterin molybdotransferase MoeA [Helcobacillus massiliensis]MDK7741461.1 molybdopterin molybdotransferase MoeA [Helcobacillus massiliensis]WOO92417.1 molybdopterin molybdotransferase MoeA [Helcobacillus massiliensis]